MENLIIGAIAGGLVYGYLYYENEKDDSKKDKSVTLLYPIITAIFVAIASYYYFSTIQPTQQSSPQVGGSNIIGDVANKAIAESSAFGNVSDSYFLIGKNALHVPNTDVFIDIAKF